MNYKKVRRLCSMAATVLVLLSFFVVPASAGIAISDYLPDGVPTYRASFIGIPLLFEFPFVSTIPDFDHSGFVGYTIDPVTSINLFDDYYEPVPYVTSDSLSGLLWVDTEISVDSDRTEIFYDESSLDIASSLYGQSVFNFSTSAFRDTTYDVLLTDGSTFDIIVSDFYCWSEDTFDDYYSYNWDSEIFFRIPLTDDLNGFSFDHAEIVWSIAGSDERNVYTVDSSDPNADDFRNGDFWADCDFWAESDIPGQVYYIHSFNVILRVNYQNGSSLMTNQLFDMSNGMIVQNFVPGLRDFDATYGVPIFDPEGNPSVPLMSYVTWLGTAASGFLELQIFPGFRIGGLLMTVIAFAFVIWFLKVFAGG